MMKKIIFVSLLISCMATALYSQVTIGADASPKKFSILELVSTATDPRGLRLPHLSEDDKLLIHEELLGDAENSKGLLIYNTSENRMEVWDGSQWITVQVPPEPWLVSGSSGEATSNTEDIYHKGHITIGNSALAVPSAALNVDATNKGVLLPRVELVAADDQMTIPNPVVGLLVYNTGTAESFPVDGYMYWNGVEWRLINASTSETPFATFVCGQASLDPEQVLQSGVPISAGTVLRIPYTVGNGGMYHAVVIHSTEYPTSDVQATISSGILENGSGYLAFHVTGTPTATQGTPTGVTFDLTPFYDANPTFDTVTGCETVTVGTEVKADIISISAIDNLKFTNDQGVAGYATQLTTPDGKFSVRAFIVSHDYHTSANSFGYDGVYGMNLQIRSNMTTDVVIAGQFNWQWGGSGGNGANYLGLQPGRWSGDSEQSIDNASQTYWANYVSPETTGIGAAVVAPAPITTGKTQRGIFVNWGNSGIYASGRPERRTYSWTINDGGQTKTAYILTFSSSALKPSDFANSTTCPSGICSGTKVFMMIDQITAP